MNSKLQQDFRNFQTPQDAEVFKEQLASKILVDFGIIEDIQDGLAYIKTFSVDAVGTIKYVTAELLQAGSGIEGVTAGMLCLLIYPKSPIQSLLNKTIFLRGSSYDARSVKCIPLSCYAEGNPVVWQRSGEDLILASTTYTLTFSPKTISFLSPRCTVDLSDTSLRLCYGTNTLTLSDEGMCSEVGVEYDVDNHVRQWKGKIDQNTDGSLKISTGATLNDSSESFAQNVCSFGIDGTLDIKAGITKDDKYASQIIITPQGNIKLVVLADGSEKSSLVLDKSGTVTITNTGAYKLSGNGVTIDGTDGKVSIKNSSVSLYTDILKSMLTTLNTTLATQGSPGAHQVVPNQFQQEADALDALME